MFFFKFERAVQLTINSTQSSLCFCCYNYQFFYVLGLSCSSLQEYFGFDAQLLVSHRSCLKKPELISNAVVSYKKQSQPPFFMFPQKVPMRHFKVLYWTASQHFFLFKQPSERVLLLCHGSPTHCCSFKGRYSGVLLVLRWPCPSCWHMEGWTNLKSDSENWELKGEIVSVTSLSICFCVCV